MQLSSDYPPILLELSKACRLPFTKFIQSHTIIPFYQPFSSPYEYHQFLDTLEKGQSSQAIASFSLLANRLSIADPNFKYCLSCLQSDIFNFGVSYWHCTHQLPGISCCPIHAEKLIKIKKHRNKLLSPTEKAYSNLVSLDSAEYRYATLAADSFSNHAFFEHTKLYQTYHYLLADRGFLTAAGYIRELLLKKALSKHWGSLFNETWLKRLNPLDKKSRFPECLFHSANAHHHPIKHLLLIGFLSGSWNEFIKAYTQDNQLEPKEKTFPIAVGDSLKSVKSLACSLMNKDRSLTFIAHKVGLSVTTVRCLAESQGANINVRPKKIYGPERRAILRQLMFGASTKSLSKKYKTSIGAIELILRSHPDLIPLRKRIRFFHALKKNRSSLQLTIEENPSFYRSDIRRAIPSAYMWLYRHDKQWLYENLPLDIPRHKRATGARS
jgi:hypothetical protein